MPEISSKPESPGRDRIMVLGGLQVCVFISLANEIVLAYKSSTVDWGSYIRNLINIVGRVWVSEVGTSISDNQRLSDQLFK